jgi:ectoine hydroxylase-related dioxygenase (phytanoyl-CoA dioxygenase family)
MHQRLQYELDGLIFPIGVLTPEEVAHYRSACAELEARLGGQPRTVEVRQMHLHFRWAYELATHPRVLDAVEELLGPNLLVWSTELFAKHPGDKVAIGWHRDEDYTGFDPLLSTTAWIALSPSTPENGCLQVIPGSHHGDSLKQNDKASVAGPLDSSDSRKRAVNVVLRAGEMSLHDGRLLHGSDVNSSNEERIGLAIRYVTPAARPIQGRPAVVLARGIDSYQHFQIVAPPDEIDFDYALEHMRDSASRHLDAMLENLRTRKSRI